MAQNSKHQFSIALAKTVKPSPFSNRGYERSEHPRSTHNLKLCTLTGCPLQWVAATPSESYPLTSCRPRVLATLVPPVIKR